MGVADGRVQAGVRHPDDRIGFHGMLLGKKGPGSLAGEADAAAVQDRIGPGKIDVLEDAHVPRGRPAVGAVGMQAFRVCGHDLTGLDVPDEGGADCVQRAAFRSKNDRPVRPFSNAERPETVPVARRDQLLGRGDDQGIGAFEHVHRRGHGLFDAAAAQPLPDDDVGDHLGIGGGVKNGALLLQLAPKLQGIGEVPVMGERHAALPVVDEKGLDVPAVVGAGRCVADVPDRDPAAPERAELLLREDLAHEPDVTARRKDAVIVHHDARAFLSPVLQGIEPVVGQGGKIRLPRSVNAENAAFFVNVALRHFFPIHAPSAGA